jgi:hypothetical protein
MPDVQVEFYNEEGKTVAVATYSEKEFNQILEELCLLQDAGLLEAVA